MKFKIICFAQIKIVCFIHTVLVSGSTFCEWFWTTNPLDISYFIVSYQFCALLFIYLFIYLRLWWCNETGSSSNQHFDLKE